jgi:hypothetical protein
LIHPLIFGFNNTAILLIGKCTHRWILSLYNSSVMRVSTVAIEKNKELYKRRQEIVEHPGVYPAKNGGTMKRQWGFDYTLMKGKQKVDGDVGLMFIAYLFTRMRNILGLQGFWRP